MEWKSNGHVTRYMKNGEWFEKEKLAYPNLDSAISHARKMNLRNEQIHKMMAYKCSICGQYHIGRTKSVLTNKDREHYKKVERKLNIYG